MNDCQNVAMEAPRAMQNMAPGLNYGNIAPVLNYGNKEQEMTLKNHKKLTDLAYRVKDFIDANGGLNYQEACQFGNLMTSIIHLK